jgi:hypothetical protein
VTIVLSVSDLGRHTVPVDRATASVFRRTDLDRRIEITACKIAVLGVGSKPG